jgi:hypothetical protein
VGREWGDVGFIGSCLAFGLGLAVALLAQFLYAVLAFTLLAVHLLTSFMLGC